jgi:hypothetical protein
VALQQIEAMEKTLREAKARDERQQKRLWTVCV